MQRLSDRSNSSSLNISERDAGEISCSLPRGGLIGGDSASSPSSSHPQDVRPDAAGPSNRVGNLPHQPAHHRVVHRTGTLPENHQWRALADRITFPNPSSNRRSTTNDHHRLSNNARSHHSTRRVHPTLLKDEPLLGDEKIVDRKHDVPWYVEKYRGLQKLEMGASLWMDGTQQDVFLWWYSRVMGRMERKLNKGIEMDFHEKVLSTLDTVSDGEYNYASVNYFAEMMVPKNGFTVGQVEEYQRDPHRWERRNRREEEFEMDESGELRAAWRAKTNRLKLQGPKRELEAQRNESEAKRRRQWREQKCSRRGGEED